MDNQQLFSVNSMLPVEQVAGITQLAEGDPLEEFTKDRNFFCDLFNPYFDLCHEGTKIPVWCDNNSFEIFCPDDVGFEYDPVTGSGGSSGGAGASRTWDAKICFDASFNKVPCPTEGKPKHMINHYKGDPYDGFQVTDIESVYANDYVTCLDNNLKPLDCDYSTSKIGWGVAKDGLCYWSTPTDIVNNKPVPCKINYTLQSTPEGTILPSVYYFDDDMRMIDRFNGLPITDENLTGGVPNYVEPPPPPPDPYDVTVPVGNEECGAICTWLSYIYNIMRVVNESVLKVDSSIQEMVLSMTGEPLPINSVLLEKLNEILVAIDKVSFELVKEAETNFWDVLGTGLGDIFDFVEFLIDKVIYLVVPEDSTQILNNFDRLSKDVKDKVKPLHDIQVNITEAVTIEDKEFTNIQIDLPKYGVVPFYKVDYLLEAMPYIRMLIGGMMIMTTSIWAYRKVSSELIK